MSGVTSATARRLGPAQGAVLDMHQLALKVASASRARLVGHVRPPRLPFPTSDGPPGGRWRSGFASTRLHATAQPHTESPDACALLERTRECHTSLKKYPSLPPYWVTTGAGHRVWRRHFLRIFVAFLRILCAFSAHFMQFRSSRPNAVDAQACGQSLSAWRG